jgi:alcohol dehydrogenase
MKTLYYGGTVEIREIPAPVPAPGEALIRVRKAGVCNTDVEIVKGYMSFEGVLGHEFVGEVESAAERVWIGRRVVGEINAGCGECDFCRSGLERHCAARTVLGIVGRNGAFAEKLTLPLANLHIVPDSVPDEKAVFTEPVAACFEMLEQVEIEPSDTVAVIGDGKLGSLAAQVLRTATENLIVIGKHDDKLGVLRDKFAIDSIKESEIADRRFEIVVECSGNPGGLELATRIVRPRGAIVLKSTYRERPCIDTSRWVIDEVAIVGSRCGPFEPALRALENGTVDPLPLIERTFPFDRAVEAFEAARKPGTKKILLDFR